MDRITLNAYGKVNIGLDVTGRRDDGYHLVKMIMQSVDICDEVTVKREPEGISLTCDDPEVPAGPSNLAWKAAAMVMEAAGLKGGVSIDIKKNIPMAAGMAGGSTDAAAVIRGMNKVFELGMTLAEMDSLAVKIGADVAFCLRRGTYLAEGIGEVLTKTADIPDCHLVIVNPGISISTPYVYKKLDGIASLEHPDIEKLLQAISSGSVEQMAASMGNILELVTETENPVITDIKKDLESAGAIKAIMTGSGPTVFGIFDDTRKAGDACRLISQKGYGRTFTAMPLK